MKHKFTPFLAVIGLLLFASCNKEPKEKLNTDNPNFQVEFLFEVDGCKVYRFSDAGNLYYFTSCQGSVQRRDKYGLHEISTSIDNEVFLGDSLE